MIERARTILLISLKPRYKIAREIVSTRPDKPKEEEFTLLIF
jgi:hypothetical protein